MLEYLVLGFQIDLLKDIREDVWWWKSAKSWTVRFLEISGR